MAKTSDDENFNREEEEFKYDDKSSKFLTNNLLLDASIMMGLLPIGINATTYALCLALDYLCVVLADV